MLGLEMDVERQRDAYEEDIKKFFTNFLETYQDREGKTYRDTINNWVEGTGNVLTITSEHLAIFNHDLYSGVFENYYKYQDLLDEALNQMMKEVTKEKGYLPDPNTREDPPEKCYITFTDGIGGANEGWIGIRELKSHRMGRLESLIGTVTRTTQVRPELIVGVFKCQNCNRSSKPIEQQFKYTLPKKCMSENCDSKSWELDQSASEFADFQQLRVQEDPNTIPPGGMPRSINIVLRNHNAEKAQPGDMCKFVGYLCVVPDIASMLKPGERTVVSSRNMDTRGNTMEMDGVKGIKGVRELNYKFMFIANNVVVQNQQFHEIELTHEEEEEEKDDGENREKYTTDVIYSNVFKNYDKEEIKIISELKDNPRLYDDLADSLFPSIFGHTEIKKAVMLQLFGGVHKITSKNKIKIRGDINVLIVGDPSTAKSQFLKTVNKFVPRSIYTNGKTTSAAGLTASVVRDDQGNVSIEAGALMLADNGVCCIDEFDKMNLTDVTAIHEAMEQQTISIAKAGVHATLNARTSILAAANPIFGRYDKSKNLQKNINISPPIMSRFDLFFVICDESSQSHDSNLCDFMIRMHREKENALIKRYDTKTIRFYMSVAKKIKPRLTRAAADKLRNCYLKLRENSKVVSGMSYIATVRQLESMIRLSEAMARLHLDIDITTEHVDEAYKLISNSITKLEKPDIVIEEEEGEGKENDNENKANIALQDEMKRKEAEKKEKKISLSSEVYHEIINNAMELFRKEKQQRGNSEEELDMTQANIINYMISLEVEKGLINSEDEEKNYRKIVRAVIKKMIKEERMLMVVEDNIEENERKLAVHSNYVQQ